MPKHRTTKPTPDELITLTSSGRIYNIVQQQRANMEVALGVTVSMKDALETLIFALFDNCRQEFADQFNLQDTDGWQPPNRVIALSEGDADILSKLREFYERTVQVPFTRSDVVNMLIAQAYDKEYDGGVNV